MEFENNNDYVVEIVDLLDKIESKQENYYQKSKNEFDYETHEKEMRELTVPFEDTFEKENCLLSANVLTDIDAIVENQKIS